MKFTAEKYARVLYDITDGKSEDEISSAISSFVSILKENEDLAIYKEITKRFESLWKEKKSVVEAEVISASDLDESRISDIKEFLKEKYKKKNSIVKIVKDSSVVGGFIIRVEDEVIDASISGKLKRLGNKLAS